MFGSFSYQTKIFLALAAFLFAVLTIINVINYYRNESLIMNDLAQNKQQTTIKLQEQVDDMLKEMDKLSISVNASDSIMSVMKGISSDSDRNYFIEHPAISADVRNALLSFTSLQPLKGRISLVSRFGDYLDLSNKMDNIKADKSQIRLMPTFREYLGMEEYKRYLAPHPDSWSVSGERVVSVVRPLRDNYNVYGYVEISYAVKELENIFFFRNDLTFGNVLILGSDRSILFSSLSQAQERKFDDGARLTMTLNGEFGHFQWRHSGTRQMVFYSKLTSTDWNILLVEDLSAFLRPIESLRFSSITIFFGVLTVLLFLLYLYTNRVTRPLRRLKDSLANVDLTKLELLPAKLRTRNEITLLGVAFQGLLNELKISMRQAEKSNQRAMVAQMNALQAQVNPHFLHNTLTVIAAHGKSSGNPKVTEICIALSDMLRYTMKFDRKDSTIGAEIEHVEQYLTLMQSKYEGILEIETDIAPDIRPVPIPRLTMQPLVENAFHHGFSGIDPPWKLSVRGIVNEGRWTITIADNGIGLSPELLEKINVQVGELRDDPGRETERLAEEDEENENDLMRNRQGNGIGLANVVARLYLFYGGEVEFRADNSPGGGAIFSITGRR
ncbi:sensor histidine kinase [Cohnella endophytica]|uniref:Sensor histidine kinase n=1 Tax=Cohnella endophytica TaxID=2419778 RepID=A0A494Y1W9_9BACL|nr:sensor histidine kinase [Cohnella endophytica]RKP54447.1 sensor histidine kinase [Cohnella endophytica]